jgi:microcystin-dependent protein
MANKLAIPGTVVRTGSLITPGGEQGIQGIKGNTGQGYDGCYVGTILAWPSPNVPTGWLTCDGAEVEKAAYPELYEIVSTRFGAGSGSGTTFNLPDLRGKVIIGIDTEYTLASIGGEKTHTLIAAEIPAHNHSISDPTHIHSHVDPTHAHTHADPTHAHSLSDPSHQHPTYDPTHAHSLSDPGHSHVESDPTFGISGYQLMPMGGGVLVGEQAANTSHVGIGVGVYGAYTGVVANWVGTGMGVYGAYTGTYDNPSGVGTSSNASGTGIVASMFGGNGAHNNMQPYLALNYIIRAIYSAIPLDELNIPLADSTTDGLMRMVSGETTDFVDGTNNCRDLATEVLAIATPFPEAPIDDKQYARKNAAWAEVIIPDIPPSGIEEAPIDGRQYARQDAAWTEVVAPPPTDGGNGSVSGLNVSIGSIVLNGSATIPQGWLACDGSEVNRTTYDLLFEAIGTIYGIGDDSTTFNLPDIRGRIPMGSGQGKQGTGELSDFVTSFTTGLIRDDFSGWVGIKFQVGSEDLIVSTLGRYVSPERTNSAIHTLQLRQDPSTPNIVGQVSIDTTGRPTGSFAYVALASPVTLTAGSIYYLLSYEAASSGDLWYDDDSIPTTTTDATILGSVYTSGSPTDSGPPIDAKVGLHIYVPVNLQFGLPPLTDRLLGSIGGEETHLLTVEELPAHSHSTIQDAHSHTASQPAHSHTSPAHVHSVLGTVQSNAGTGPGLWIGTPTGDPYANTTSVGVAIDAAQPAITVGNTTSSVAISNTGGGLAHNNIQPFLTLGYIINAENVPVSGGGTPPSGGTTVVAALPVGSVVSFAGSIVEEGWLVCDGSEASRTIYPDLYVTVGDTYGAGDGSTTFNLPDIQGKVIVGSGAGSGLTDRLLGSIGGEETHVLSIAEMPIHTHIQDLHNHGVATGGGTIGANILSYVTTGVYDYTGSNLHGATATNQNTGGGLAHNTMPPYIVLTYVIKAIKDEVSGGGNGSGETYVVRTLPIGTIVSNASAILSDGWLVCDGSEQDPAIYFELFAAIGTTYGGDGTVFNLPDFRDRIALGVSSTRILGSIGGEETHVLTIEEMPSHTHIQDAHTHAQDAHSHIIGQYTAVFPSGTSPWGAYIGFENQGTSTFTAVATNQNSVATNQNAGGGLTHNNIQPYLAVDYIIKAKEIEAIIDVVEDAPIDDQLYGRKNGEWEVIPAGGGEGGGGGIVKVNYDLGHYAPTTELGTGDYTVGVCFTVTSAINPKLKQVSFYKTALEAPNVNHSFILYDAAMQIPLWNHPPDGETAVEGWITHVLVAPLPLVQGTTYMLTVHCSSEFIANTTPPHLPYQDGPLSAERGGKIAGSGCPWPDSEVHYGLDLVIEVEEEQGPPIEEAPIDGLAYARQDAEWVETNLQGVPGKSVEILQSVDEATAIADSIVNPNNIYFWIVLPPPPVLTSLNPAQGDGSMITSPVTLQVIGSGFTANCKGGTTSGLAFTERPTTFVSETELSVSLTFTGNSHSYISVQDEHGQRSNEIDWWSGPP